MTPQQFIQRIAPIAQKLRREGSHIFPSVRIAQSALETGWKIPSWNNMVGFKVGNGKINQYWKGKYVNKGTWEVYDGKRVDVRAKFRAYDTIEDSFRDQDLLFEIQRYERVRKAKSPEEQAQMLQACGYATDPQYALKIMTIVKNYGLLKYDEEEKMIQELQRKIEVLERSKRELEQKIVQIQSLLSMQEIPEWARQAVANAAKAGVVDTTKGRSYDFYSLVTVLNRLGVFNEKNTPPI